MLFRDIHFTCEGPQTFRFYFAFYVKYVLAISPYLRSLPNGKYNDAVIQNRGMMPVSNKGCSLNKQRHISTAGLQYIEMSFLKAKGKR
jgi:hypothetical protein